MVKQAVNIFVLILSVFTLTGCQSFLSDNNGRELTDFERIEQEDYLKEAEAKLNENKNAEAQDLFLKFRKKFGISQYYYRAQLGLARSLEGQGQWAEAITLHKETIEATRTKQPEIAAYALYQSSFCYEALGDESRVMLSLKDAEKYSKYLPEEIFLAEIPARLAASYFRQGRIKESQAKKLEAEKGLNKLIGMRDGSEWLARTYYLMGMMNMTQLSEENFQASIDGLKFSQKYTLRSVELGIHPWSKLASDSLLSAYRDLWNVTQNLKVSASLDADTADRIKTDTQIRMVGELLTVMSQLKDYRMPELRKGNNEYLDNLFWSLDGFQKKADGFLIEKSSINRLTKESKNLRPTKQEVQLVDPDTKSVEQNEIEQPIK